MRIVENGRHVGPRPPRPEAANQEAPASPATPVAAPEPVAPDVRVNGRAITRAQIAAEAQHHPAATPAAALEAAAQALVVRELLLQEAAVQGIAAEPEALGRGRAETEEEALIRALLEDQVDVPTADEAACRRYYDANRRRFASPTLHEARHILLAAAPEDEAARTEATRQAQELIALLGEAPGRFGELAAAFSACPSKESGGNLGQLSPGQTVPEFEAALERIDEGRMSSEPVTSRFGLHVIALDRRIAGQTLPFEAVRDRIAAYLEASSWSRGVAQYLSLLAGAARVEGVTLAGSASPLVQ